MEIMDQFPSKYIKADVDIEDAMDGGTVLTINDCETEMVGSGSDASKKPVLYFAELDKGFVLNKTNASTLVALFGKNTDAWHGNRVTLVATDVQYGSDMVRGIRVSRKLPPAARPAKARPARLAEPEVVPTTQTMSDADLPY